MLGRALDDFAQQGRGFVTAAIQRERTGLDAEVFGFANRILELAVGRDRALYGRDREVPFTAGHVNFGEARDGLRGELRVAQRLGFLNGDLRDLQGAVELALRAAHNAEVMA